MLQQLNVSGGRSGLQFIETGGHGGRAKAVEDVDGAMSGKLSHTRHSRSDSDTCYDIEQWPRVVGGRADIALRWQDSYQGAVGGCIQPVGKEAILFKFDSQLIGAGGCTDECVGATDPGAVDQRFDADELPGLSSWQWCFVDGFEANSDGTFREGGSPESAE